MLRLRFFRDTTRSIYPQQLRLLAKHERISRPKRALAIKNKTQDGRGRLGDPLAPPSTTIVNFVGRLKQSVLAIATTITAHKRTQTYISPLALYSPHEVTCGQETQQSPPTFPGRNHRCRTATPPPSPAPSTPTRPWHRSGCRSS